ncbi:hypothetical protein [Streptococcus merionis]|uniref:hypothetical protein n=1 Tax=Streptococcus merionis TaxID=400065 RepID=UPI0035125DF2
MENPWKKVSSNKNLIVPKEDEKYIKKLLSSPKYGKLKAEQQLKLNIYPQHFVGDIKNSKIIILSLNPGYSSEYYDFYQNEDKYRDILKNNLELKEKEVKFHAFDYSTTEKRGYWDKKLYPWFKNYIDEKRSNNENGLKSNKLDTYFTNTVSLIEFFPYHSEKYSDIFDMIADGEYLPSQKFIFNLIENRIKNKDVIIILARSFKKWYQAIPNLMNYEKCFEVSNPQNPSLKFENINRVTRKNSGDIIKKSLRDE